ncbi:MAG: hypothetical protein JOY94_22260, partial [Methylobacteriaceae bacterium]|nr:hypothetical protein [Methylobacteriaceae bacterium]
DAILSRYPFIPCVKTAIAEMTDEPAWRRVVPPLSELPTIERQRLGADFRRWDASLPLRWQSLPRAELPMGNVVALRRA